MNLTNYEIYHEDKSHTSPEFPYNTYLCSIPLDFSAVNMHWHEEVEIIVIKKGMGIISVDLTEYEVKNGDIVFVMSGQLHAIRQLGNNAMEYENILFRPSMLRSSGRDLCWENFIFPLLSASVQICPLIRSAKLIQSGIDEYIRKIDKLCDEKLSGYQLAVKGYLFLILHCLASEIDETSEKMPKKHLKKIKSVLSYVEEHYSEDISVEEMAELSHILREKRKIISSNLLNNKPRHHEDFSRPEAPRSLRGDRPDGGCASLQLPRLL